MLRLNKMFSIASAVMMASALLSGCVKEKELFPKESGDANRGQIVSIEGGGDDLIGIYRDLDPINEQFELLTIRRSPKDQSQLNMPLTVKVTKNNALITAYNTANGTGFIDLPAASYTLSGDPGTITFQPGETVKTFNINLDKSKLDLSEQYAVAYSVTEVGSTGQISGEMKNILLNIGIKNKYDGVYRMTGSLVDAASATIVAKSPSEVHFITIGERSVQMYNSGTSVASFKEIFPIMNGTAESGYGGFLPEFHFDANNNVIAVTNAYGQPNPSNTRRAELDPSGVNKWENGVLKVKFFMFQPNTVAVGPRTSFDFTFEYQGSR